MSINVCTNPQTHHLLVMAFMARGTIRGLFETVEKSTYKMHDSPGN